MPPYVEGFSISFAVTSDEGLRINAGAGRKIRFKESATATGGYLSAVDVGFFVRIGGVGGVWTVIASVGEWGVN